MKTIGIIGAMDLEIDKIRQDMNVISVKNIVGMDFILGRLGGCSCVLVKCGIGKVNAAVCTQVMIDLYAVDCIINTGVGGSLSPQLSIGDIVISSEAMQHDMDISPLGYAPGVIPDMETSLFEADKALIEAARAALVECGIRGVIGRVASGDRFVADDKLKAHIADSFGAVCCEMEGGAIAHTCYLNRIPFVIIRAISDSADGSGDVDYPAFKAAAAENSEKIVRFMADSIE